VQFLLNMACELRSDKVKYVSGGFNLRIRVDLQKNNPCQIEQFLVPERRNPISADTRVWLVPNDVDRLIQDSTHEFWSPLGLAKNLDLLLQACKEREIGSEDLSPVCLTITEKSRDSLIKRFGPGYFENTPHEDDLLSRGWRFLGFDPVELNGLTSGLKGIGYKEPSWSRLRRQFGSGLNDVGLFADEATATQFAELRGKEIPSHAPFEVVGVLMHDPIPQ
jgi:hypothetical protein